MGGRVRTPLTGERGGWATVDRVPREQGNIVKASAPAASASVVTMAGAAAVTVPAAATTIAGEIQVESIQSQLPFPCSADPPQSSSSASPSSVSARTRRRVRSEKSSSSSASTIGNITSPTTTQGQDLAQCEDMIGKPTELGGSGRKASTGLQRAKNRNRNKIERQRGEGVNSPMRTSTSGGDNRNGNP